MKKTKCILLAMMVSVMMLSAVACGRRDTVMDDNYVNSDGVREDRSDRNDSNDTVGERRDTDREKESGEWVGGASEDAGRAVKDAGKGIADTAKDAGRAVADGARELGDDVKNDRDQSDRKNKDRDANEENKNVNHVTAGES